MKMNSKILSNALGRGETYLISSPENRLYLTRFPSTDGYLLVTAEERIFLTDSRYIEAACAGVSGCTQVTRLDSLKEQLPALCEQLGVEKMFVEADRMTVAQFERIASLLPGVTVAAGERVQNELDALRSVKSREELDKIKAAQAIAEAAFEHILGLVRVGMTEREVALELDYSMLRGGAQALSFETIAVSGRNSSKPHGVPTDKKIESGDFLTLDFGAVVDGMHSDMTRTVAVGAVSEKQRRVYATVLEAQSAALSTLREGTDCVEADAAARNVIKAAGYGEFFGHGTGHGVGIEIHEAPNLSPKSTSGKLARGNVVTVEPGIYLPGEFGVRIEDMAYITADGCENLTSAPKKLIIL